MSMSAAGAAALEWLRPLCTGLPEVVERPSHGEPAWFVRGRRMFATFADHHHDDRVAVWCAALPAVRELRVHDDPGRFFVPPYVGVRGWVGVRLDDEPERAVVAAVLRDAYRLVAPASLRARVVAPPG